MDDTSAHAMVLALVKFFNLYGVPTNIYSDNTCSFVAVCNLIKQVFTSDEFEGKFRIFNIKHHTCTQSGLEVFANVF